MATLTLTDFTGNLEGVADTDYRLVAAGARASSPWNTHAADADVVAHVLGTEGTGNAADKIGDCDITPNSWETDGGWIGQHAMRYSWVGKTGSSIPQVPVNADFTVEFWWHKTAASPTDDRRFFYLGGQDYNRILFSDYRELAPGNWRYRRYLRANNPPGTSAAILVTGITFAAGWQHYCIERSGNTLRSYVNGVVSGGTTDASGVTTFSSQDRWSAGDGAALGWRWNDIYLTKRALHAGVDFSPTRFSSASLRTAATVVDSGSAGSTWSQLVTTIAAVTGDETYAVYIYPSESATVPAASSGDWQLVGSGYTTGQTLSISGTGRYCHTKVVTGASTGIGQYAVELDGLEWTYTPASSSVRRYNPHYLIGRNPGVM